MSKIQTSLKKSEIRPSLDGAATQSKITTNSQNAKKSTGPRSSEGKSTVSQNALKHGLSARKTVISTESQADFDLYRDRILTELAPFTPMESMLAERIVSLSWRLKRAGRIQNEVIDAMNEDHTNNPLAKLKKSFFPKNPDPDKTDSSASPIDLALGRIAIRDFGGAKVLDRLLMYERRIEHSLYRTILEFQRLRLIRDLKPTGGIDKTDKDTEFQLLLGG
ncbi:MAG: hypothetical protein PVH77_09670 [Phycisphaerales bacterium]|jgi:hypothetical protein